MNRYKSLFEQKSYQIYCDMDGVLTDFNKSFIQLTGIHPKNFSNEYGIDKMWEVINNYDIKNKYNRFWLTMDWMPDAHILWNYIKDKHPILLTTPVKSVIFCKEDKLNWIKRELGDFPVIYEKDKFKYATSNNILIDDFEDKIIDWREAGGIGILHSNAYNTIEQLKKLIIEV